ncbi:stage III sporulation protein AC [Hathewaya limosa]|uniref:Stage III sporulation protein AC n=1 Tax=Hathewaya limosa TaxID=1536 RepID=A0ABU0JRV0_HATLI|nr:stage III sporulation protein AC [Hathewaya limosa]AWZ48258.1 stage III sporulation protein AC [Clostridiaceae bacterium 14S0207]MDQ0479809.1 stage III sporulation protein AC [Hathewaya limosa]
MLDVSLIMKIAGVGILVVVIDKVLKSAGKDDYAVITNLAGIIIILLMVVNLINKLFDTVKTLFTI